MTRLLYDIEDYLGDAAEAPSLPKWLRRVVSAMSRTVGEAGDIAARHFHR
jgi:hypothetical protein